LIAFEGDGVWGKGWGRCAALKGKDETLRSEGEIASSNLEVPVEDLLGVDVPQPQGDLDKPGRVRETPVVHCMQVSDCLAVVGGSHKATAAFVPNAPAAFLSGPSPTQA
jgi:hypothetical protein